MVGMEMDLRPYAFAGVALIGGGVVAAVPVLPIPHLPNVNSAAVQLTASDADIDSFLTSFGTEFNDASANSTQLFDNFALAPFVGAQQATVDGFGYLQDLINGTSFDTVLGDIQTNLTNVLSAFPLIDASTTTTTDTTGMTLDALHSLVFGQLPGMLPAGTPAAVTEVLNFLASPASGFLIGALGPLVSPEVALFNSVESIVTAFQADDSTTALQDLAALPANVLGSFFNGATLNLDSLVPAVNDAGLLPAGDSISALSFAFGGLLSPGAVGDTFKAATGSIHAVGGSIFNSLGIDLNVLLGTTPISLDLAANPVGPLGAAEGFDELVGILLGDNWNGKGASAGSPLAGLTFPTLPDTDAAAASSVNLADLLGDFSGLNDLGTGLSTEAATSLSSLVDVPQDLVHGLLSLF
jgi:hypothetical protein